MGYLAWRVNRSRARKAKILALDPLTLQSWVTPAYSQRSLREWFAGSRPRAGKKRRCTLLAALRAALGRSRAAWGCVSLHSLGASEVFRAAFSHRPALNGESVGAAGKLRVSCGWVLLPSDTSLRLASRRY